MLVDNTKTPHNKTRKTNFAVFAPNVNSLKMANENLKICVNRSQLDLVRLFSLYKMNGEILVEFVLHYC